MDDSGDPSGQPADHPGVDDHGDSKQPWTEQQTHSESQLPIDDPVDKKPDTAEPLPEPSDDEIIEPETAQQEIIDELKAAFVDGAGPFEQLPDETFLETSWFDFEYLDRYEKVTLSWVDKPYAYVSVLYDPVVDEYRYHVGTPNARRV